MFTLKLVRSSKELERTRVVCTKDYTVMYEKDKDTYTIAVQGLVNGTGTTFFHSATKHTTYKRDLFDVCYIENEAGKIIDCIQAGL